MDVVLWFLEALLFSEPPSSTISHTPSLFIFTESTINDMDLELRWFQLLNFSEVIAMLCEYSYSVCHFNVFIQYTNWPWFDPKADHEPNALWFAGSIFFFTCKQNKCQRPAMQKYDAFCISELKSTKSHAEYSSQKYWCLLVLSSMFPVLLSSLFHRFQGYHHYFYECLQPFLCICLC